MKALMRYVSMSDAHFDPRGASASRSHSGVGSAGRLRFVSLSSGVQAAGASASCCRAHGWYSASQSDSSLTNRLRSTQRFRSMKEVM